MIKKPFLRTTLAAYLLVLNIVQNSSYHGMHPAAICMQDYEAELKKYMAVEGAVAAIPSTHTISALSLELGPLKGSLKAEAASWKAQFAKNLHAKGAEDLRVGVSACGCGEPTKKGSCKSLLAIKIVACFTCAVVLNDPGFWLAAGRCL